MTPQPKPESNEPDGPCIVTPLHVQDRPATDEEGKAIIGKYGWRINTILQVLYAKEKLGDRGTRRALDRLDAGLFYSKLWWEAEPHGRDSTQRLNAVKSGGVNVSELSDDQRKAYRKALCIQSYLGQKDRIILRAVCEKNMLPNEGVKLANCDQDTRVFARFRDALDELILAIETARKSGFLKFNMERV